MPEKGEIQAWGGGVGWNRGNESLFGLGNASVLGEVLIKAFPRERTSSGTKYCLGSSWGVDHKY